MPPLQGLQLRKKQPTTHLVGSIIPPRGLTEKLWLLVFAFVAGDDAVFDMDNAPGVLGDVGFMGDQHNGIAFAMEVFHPLHDFIAGLRIKVAGRLIGQDKRGIVDQLVAPTALEYRKECSFVDVEAEMGVNSG